MASSRTCASASGVAGWCSASKDWSKAVKSDCCSPGRISVSAWSPCLTPLRRTAARPSGVLGPVLFFALRRLAAICRLDAMVSPGGFGSDFMVPGGGGEITAGLGGGEAEAAEGVVGRNFCGGVTERAGRWKFGCWGGNTYLRAPDTHTCVYNDT